MPKTTQELQDATKPLVKKDMSHRVPTFTLGDLQKAIAPKVAVRTIPSAPVEKTIAVDWIGRNNSRATIRTPVSVHAWLHNFFMEHPVSKHQLQEERVARMCAAEAPRPR
jgi:O-phosphoseryl-tRNA(Cys) synthetase